MKKFLLGEPVIFTYSNTIKYGTLVGLKDNLSIVRLSNGINITTDQDVFEDTKENRNKLINIQYGKYDVKPLIYNENNLLPIGTVFEHENLIYQITRYHSKNYGAKDIISGTRTGFSFSSVDKIKIIYIPNESQDFNSLYLSDSIYADTDFVQPFTLPTLSPFNTKEEVEYILNLISKEIVEEDHRLALDLLSLLRLRVDRLEISLKEEIKNEDSLR